MGSNTRVFARLFGLVAITLLGLLALFGGSPQAQAGVPANLPAGAQGQGSEPVSKIADQVLKDTANGGKTSFVILMAEQANLTAAYSMKDQDARGWYVYNTLREVAARTQAPIWSALAAAGAQYQSYWAANMIVATGDRQLVESLAARSDVKAIDSNDATKWINDPPATTPSSADGPDAPEWGVQNVNAPAVWALGDTGQGIVVASQDTGVRWTHAALKPQYRGWNGTTADHNYNWWDAIHDSVGNPCGNNSQQPCDDYFHGSHTTGSAVGWDGGTNQIGVAPGAKWIGCRNMDQGTGTPARYTECFQFMIAPTDLAGQNPNPALRPHVIINSWGCPVSEGCTTGAELETIVNNTQSAGIFVEVSAGNSGPGCSSVSDPPAIYSAAFSTGAIDSSNTLAGFSSRGPSLYYNPALLKPNVSAPGVNVRSASNSSDTAYTTASGTSMAGPHVVGVVALIWSARPGLVRDITATKELLQNTANHNVIVNPVQTCGGIPSSQIPNNSFGYGRVDALAAYNATQGTPTPTATGTPPTNTPTPTATSTPCSAGAIQNGGFETGTFAPWTILDTNPMPVVSTAEHHSGTYSALLGTVSGTEPNGDGSIYQQFTVPAGGGTLSYWWNGGTTDSITFDWQDAYITDTSGNILATIMHQCQSTSGWVQQTFNLAPYAGQTVRVKFLVHQDGFGDDTYMYVDDVTILTACGSTTPAPPTNTPAPPTDTPAPPSATETAPAQATNTSVPTGTAAVPTETGTPLVPTATPTECVMDFVDVHPGDWSYTYINWMYCNNIITGYHTSPPCGHAGEACFKPNNPSTRAQISKIVVLGFHVPINTTGGPHFQDVPAGSVFYDYIETLYNEGAINGYPCGGGGYPCVPPQNLPYFRPDNVVTRGQLTKIVVLGAGITINTTGGPHFEDVPVGSTFYQYVETLSNLGSIHGYPCGGPNEPCDPQGRAYFRPGNDVTRAQLSQIVYLSQPSPPR